MMNCRRADSKLSRLDNIGKLHNRSIIKKKIKCILLIHLVRQD